MYCDYFGLREAPFDNTPDPHFFYPTPDHEEALATLMYGVSRYKGFLMLSGEVGTGKTLVSRVMLKKFGDSIAFANIANTYVSPLELLQAVCDEFGIAHAPDAGSLQLSKLLEQFLLDQFARNTPVVLVVDEAQNLSHEAFEQLRMIGNLESDDAKLLQIVMVGQCELRTRFQKPELRQLRQRVFRSYHLPALGRKACEGYIEHRLKVAGHPDGRVFPDDAVDSIAAFSRGLPRTINNICDSTLLAAYSTNRPITQALVREVIEQMMGLELETQQTTASTNPSPQPVERPVVATAGHEDQTTSTAGEWVEISSETHPAAASAIELTASADDVPAMKPAPKSGETSDLIPSRETTLGMNTRENRILERLAAISRDIQREREYSQERKSATWVTSSSTAGYLGTPAKSGAGHLSRPPIRSSRPGTPRRQIDVAGLAALRKSVAECRLALGQLANLDPPGSTRSTSQPTQLETTNVAQDGVLTLEPDQPWLVGV